MTAPSKNLKFSLIDFSKDTLYDCGLSDEIKSAKDTIFIFKNPYFAKKEFALFNAVKHMRESNQTNIFVTHTGFFLVL